jgi:hypothetical protein
MAKWRYFAARELPKVIRDLRLPAAEPVRVTGMNRCPTHRQLLGPTTRICLRCHDEAWTEIARRYRAQGEPITTTPPERSSTMTTTTIDVIEPETAELVPAPTTLFGTSNPQVALERMSELAKTLVDLVKSQKLYTTINGKEFLYSEAWTCLGAMVGVHAIVTTTRENESGDGIVAHAEARTIRGELVGGADAECSRAEKRWKDREPYAIRSMASTRAISRALRAPLGQIVVLAGYNPAPAEEVSDDALVDQPEPAGKIPPQAKPTDDQINDLRDLIARLRELDPGTDWRARAGEIAGVPGDMLTRGGAALLIDELDKLEDELRNEAAA